nr:glycosyltransferase family 39 protein [Lachnospiraceae bacterium]
IVVNSFCRTKKEIIFTFITLIGCISFMSYTTAGLENCLLFLLSAIFLKLYFGNSKFSAKKMYIAGLLIALIAMTRMDAVLMFIPAILYLYLTKREKVSFLKAVVIGFLSLLPFILWELFSLFYFGFFVPNTAFVKLGTDIPLKEYLIRGLQYLATSTICDLPLIVVPALAVILALITRQAKYIMVALGILMYMAYIIYIGGDFMLGRHFTVLFFMSVIMVLDICSKSELKERKRKKLAFTYTIVVFTALMFNLTTRVITDQFLYGQEYGSHIADERAGYFKYTSLVNNAVSYFRTGDMCIRKAWNEEGIDEYRAMGEKGGILRFVPGISIYYNSDMYLNDQYALGDPLLSKLPAVKEENWRIGHMWREVPDGYGESAMYGGNRIENGSLKEYYDVILLITRGDLFDKNRLKAIVDINLGKYDHLIEEYSKTLDENNRKMN